MESTLQMRSSVLSSNASSPSSDLLGKPSFELRELVFRAFIWIVTGVRIYPRFGLATRGKNSRRHHSAGPQKEFHDSIAEAYAPAWMTGTNKTASQPCFASGSALHRIPREHFRDRVHHLVNRLLRAAAQVRGRHGAPDQLVLLLVEDVDDEIAFVNVSCTRTAN